jgi:hypothetical protein
MPVPPQSSIKRAPAQELAGSAPVPVAMATPTSIAAPVFDSTVSAIKAPPAFGSSESSGSQPASTDTADLAEQLVQLAMRSPGGLDKPLPLGVQHQQNPVSPATAAVSAPTVGASSAGASVPLATTVRSKLAELAKRLKSQPQAAWRAARRFVVSKRQDGDSAVSQRAILLHVAAVLKRARAKGAVKPAEQTATL